MNFSFLHAADLHLDSPLTGLEAEAPADRIRGASRQALRNLVDLALAERVDFVLLAGDLYDGDWKDWRTAQFLTAELGRLKAQGIPVYAISGNHDAASVLSRTLRLPDPVLSVDKPETRRVPGLQVAIHGQGFATRAVTVDLAAGYPDPVAGWFNIGLLHTACGSGAHENYAPCTPADLAVRGYDYWALGHVHEHAVLRRDPWIVFPGILQGRHVKEEGAKGACLVRVVEGKVAVVHRALDVLRWARIGLNVAGAQDFDAVLDRMGPLLHAAVAEAGERFLAVRLTLHGACAAHVALVRDPAETRRELRVASAGIAGPDQLWIEDIRLATTSAADVGALRAQPGIIGTLLNALDAPVAIDPDLLALATQLAGHADDPLDPDHPARAIAAGQVPDALVARARALVLAELFAN